GRRPHHQRLLERGCRVDLDRVLALFPRGTQPRMGDERDLLGEPLDVLSFFREETHRNEQWEVGVLMAGRLDQVVERPLHQLPHAVAVRPDDHAAADRRVVRHLRLHDDVAVPLAEVLGAWCDPLRFRVLGLSHYSKYPLRSLSNGTLVSVPAFRFLTTALLVARSSGPMITSRGVPRAAASPSLFRTPV